MEQDASQGAAATLQAWCEHGRDTAHAEATHQQQQQDSSDLTVGFDGDRPPSPATTTPDESTHDFRVGLITRSWFAPCQRCCMQRTTAGSGRDALVNW